MKSFLIALKSKIKSLNRRKVAVSSIFGLFLSISLVIGRQMNDTHTIDWSISTAFNFLVVFILGTIITYIFIDKLKFKSDKKYSIKRWQIFLPLFLISFFILFATYPGSYNIDITYEYDFYKAGNLGTHFPIFYNVVFCWTMEFLHGIFNSWEVAVFILNLIQITLVNLALTEVIFFLSKKLKNKNFTFLTTLFYITNPLFQASLISTSHDFGFGAFFALIVLEVIKMVEEENYFSKKSNWFKFIFFVFMLCIFRNNGLFAIVPAFVLGLFVMKGKRKKFAAIVLIPLAMFVGYNQLIVNNIVTEKESVLKESLNIPVNQMARALYYNFPRAFSEEQYKYFRVQCNWPSYGKYPMIADYQKGCLKTDYIEEHLFEFIAYWAKVGTKAPHRYIEAPFLFDLGAYYPFTTYPEEAEERPTLHSFVSYTVHRETPRIYQIDIRRYPHIKFVDNMMDELIEKQKWSKIFFFRVIWGGAFTTFLLLFTFCYVTLKKNYKYLVPLFFIFGMLLTVLLSPVILYRYLFPVVLTIPIMIYIIMVVSSSKKGSNAKK